MKNTIVKNDASAKKNLHVRCCHCASSLTIRKGIMNTATVALKEVYYHNEKNVTAETIYNSDWFNESE